MYAVCKRVKCCKTDTRYGIYKGAGTKCDHQKFGVRASACANLDLDV